MLSHRPESIWTRLLKGGMRVEERPVRADSPLNGWGRTNVTGARRSPLSEGADVPSWMSPGLVVTTARTVSGI